jgi:hyperosmotically inducible protein
MRRLLTLLIVLIGLAGCSGYLLGDRQPQPVLTPEGGSATSPRDQAISSEIRRRLQADPATSPYSIGVETNAGRVTLRGTVGSYPSRDRAVAIARGTNGVTDVSNRIVVNTNM